VFNAVGAAGIAVQVTVLALLVHGLHLHYLPATLVAVEAAVLHNFYWHHRWTWRDRRSPSWGATAGRLGRFQLLNGTISLAGNVGVMALLTGTFGLDPVSANLIAIVSCSLVNFAASEALVFRTVPFVLAILMIGTPTSAFAGPDGPTLKAWTDYVQTVEARYASAPVSGHGFFAQDLPGRPAGWRDPIKHGGVTITSFEAPAAGDGRIHHWAGATFIPNTTVTRVVDRLLGHAGQESEFYEDVIGSRLLERNGERVRIYMKLRRTTLLTATFNTEHTVDYRRMGPRRASSRSVATRIAELAEAGTPREHERLPRDDRGFLWKLNAYWRFEAVEGGVIVECESVSLSRGVPLLLRPVANPIIDRVARESLEKTLQGLSAFLQLDRGTL
jgi:putative flippase GtrA